jgi:hypothetical protein
MNAICSHEAGSLEEGTLEGYKRVHRLCDVIDYRRQKG